MPHLSISPAVAQAARSFSRRSTLLGLSAAAIASASRSSPVRAGKAGKKAKKACRRQVGKCESSINAACAFGQDEPDPECVAAFLPCCQSFRTCKATDQVFSCFIDVLIAV